MKRVIVASVLILGLGALAIWGNRMAASTLDAKLGPLLAEQLGLPVRLAPMEAHLLQLRVISPQLIMGDPQNPAVVATNVEVSLSWPELVTGNIRLVFAGADDLTIKPSRWPRSGDPAPDNYRFLDPWLPRKLQFQTGRYLDKNDASYPVQTAQWRRTLGGGMHLHWSEQRKGGMAELEAELVSLHNLLDLADFQLTLRGEIDEKSESDFALALQIAPDNNSAYTLQATLNAIDTQFTTQASGSNRWDWPDASQNRIKHLDFAQLSDFLDLYDNPNKEDTAESFLATPLPSLAPIPLKGNLHIDEIKIASDTLRNTTLKFVADSQRFSIESLRSEGPWGRLSGGVIIASSQRGWDFSLDAKLQARAGSSIGKQSPASQWLWEKGSTQLKGSGKTWGELLYSLTGHVAAEGLHHGEADTPIKIEAVLDNTPEKFAFDHLEIALGDGRFHGSGVLSGTKQRKLTLNLTGDKLHMGFLFDDEEDAGHPGIAVPEYLDVMPSLDLDWTLNASDLQAPGLTLASAHARLERTDVGGTLTLHATGHTGGTLDLTFEADYPDEDDGDYELGANFHRLDLPSMFQQPNFMHSRSSGTLNFDGSGMEMQDIFQNLHGTTQLEVEIRPDNNWQRQPLDSEKLALTGTSHFVIDGEDIVGITIKDLDIDSSEQDLTGTVSMVAARTPWLIADLKSEKLDINGLLALLPDSSEDADQANFLQSMRSLGAAQLSLKVDSLTVGDAPVSQLNLNLATDNDLFKIEEITLLAHSSRMEGSGKITWQDTLAKIELATHLTDVDLDQFLILDPNLEHVRVNGTAQLNSEGETVGELISNFTGNIDLASKELQKGTNQPRRHLLMKARRLPNGMQADVESLRLGENHLTGTVRYIRSTPPQVDIEIHNGTFSLLPWETGHSEAAPTGNTTKTSNKQDSGIRRAAEASAGAVGRVLRAPLRLLQASEDRSQTHLFSDEPLPLDAMHSINVNFKGQLDSLTSSIATLHQLSFKGQLQDGALDVSAQSAKLNGGQAKLDLKLDANAVPPDLTINADFNDVRGLTSENTYTRSGFVSLEAQGQSPAALAASLNGLIYLELGPGPFDYQNATLLSNSLAKTVFGVLLPGMEQEEPKLECGITVAEFKDGKGVTPYGYAIRTNQANLLGHFQVDLAEEQLKMNFESRSREGVGLSVGNVISNSIQVRGSLTDPHIVPRATSLAWRGWAAFMTVGLSVVAEGVLKRAMASENPCPPIKKLISKELCPKSDIAASSPRMCPRS